MVRYRVDRAREALQEAALLLEAGHTTAAVNRQYYAWCYTRVAAERLGIGLRTLYDELKRYGLE